MAVKPIPEGYHTVTPYIIVFGVEKLINFLKQAFDAKEIHRSIAPDGRIIHCEMEVGDSKVMVAEQRPGGETNISSFYLYVTDTDSTYKKAIAAGGISLMEPADQFYGDRNAGVKDAHGNSWWIGTHVEDLTPEEMKTREEEFMKKMSH